MKIQRIKLLSGLLILVFVLFLIGMSCDSTENAEKAKMKALFKKGVDAFNNRTPEILDQVWASKCIYHFGNSPEPTEMSAIEMYNSNLKETPDFQFTIEDLLVDGNKIVARLICEGTYKANARRIRTVDHWIGRVENGKIVEIWEILDELAIMKQLGYTLTPPQEEIK